MMLSSVPRLRAFIADAEQNIDLLIDIRAHDDGPNQPPPLQIVFQVGALLGIIDGISMANDGSIVPQKYALYAFANRQYIRVKTKYAAYYHGPTD